MLLVCSYNTVSKQISISKRKANFLSNKVQQRCNHISSVVATAVIIRIMIMMMMIIINKD